MIAGVSPGLPHTGHLPAIREWSLRVAKPAAARLLRLHWRIRVHGAQHVPRHGPVILAANHLGVLDGPLLVAVTRRRSFALAKQELFVGGMGAFLTHVGQIPLNRQSVDTAAIRRSLQVLRSDRVLAVFPEGIRGAGEVTHARGGAAYLALVSGAPIVPVALLGTREPGQTSKQVPRRGAPIHVVYGEPIPVPAIPWPRRKPVVAELTETVRRRLAEHVRWAQELTGLPLPGPPKPHPPAT